VIWWRRKQRGSTGTEARPVGSDGDPLDERVGEASDSAETVGEARDSADTKDSPGAPDDPAPATPLAYWEIHNEKIAAASFLGMMRNIPAVVGDALRLSWRASRRDTVLALTLQIVNGALTAAGLLATTDVLTALFQAGPTVERVKEAAPALLFIAAALGLRAVLAAVAGWAQAELEPRAERLAEIRLFELTTRVELEAFHGHEFYDAMQRARDRGVDSCGAVVRATLDIVSAAARLAGVASALAVLHPSLLPLLLVSAIPEGWATVRTARMRYVLMFRNTAIRRRKWMLADLMADRESAPEVRAFTMRRFLLGEYAAAADREVSELITLGRRTALNRLAGQGVGGLATAALYAVLAVLVLQDVVPLAVAGTAVLAIRTSRVELGQLVFAINTLYEHGLYFGDYTTFCQEASRRQIQARSRRVPADWDCISAHHVSFSFPGTDKRALDDVSVEIRRGETIALVGENGSGKTTLAKMLAGLYAPESGAVRWGSFDLLEADPDALWDRIALVEQDFTRWPMTLRHNISMQGWRRPAGQSGRSRVGGRRDRS
jgi:ATP-binding cassette, subfamily B, bacterial